jgi:CDP-diglyceride synthetase
LKIAVADRHEVTVMLRHLKNLNELILYASISCGAAFFTRLFPAFFFPILLLRLGVLAYCTYVIATIERNREFATIFGAALLIGTIGGSWDYLEVYIRYNQELIAKLLSLLVFVTFAGTGLVVYLGDVGNGKHTIKK